MPKFPKVIWVHARPVSRKAWRRALAGGKHVFGPLQPIADRKHRPVQGGQDGR